MKVKLLSFFYCRLPFSTDCYDVSTGNLWPQDTAQQSQALREGKKAVGLHVEHDLPQETPHKKLRINLTRPVRLLATQVIIQVLALYMAYGYGIMFLILSTFPSLWSQAYHEPVGIGGLNFISLGLDFIICSQRENIFGFYLVCNIFQR